MNISHYIPGWERGDGLKTVIIVFAIIGFFSLSFFLKDQACKHLDVCEVPGHDAPEYYSDPWPV